MPLTAARRRPVDRSRRTTLALVLVSVVLGSTLTACGNGPGDTTCQEYDDLSADEQVQLLGDAVDQDGTEAQQKAFDALDDDARSGAVDAVKATCADEDDDTPLDDIEDFSPAG